MGRKTDLKPEEKQRIVELLSHGKTSLNISKLIHQDHRTVKRFIENSNKVRGRLDKGRFRKISRREISAVKKTLAKNPHSTSATIFHEAGVPSRSRAGRCKILRSIGKVRKPIIKPPLKQRHKLARLDWAKSCMKTNFENMLFTDESRATLDGPDGRMSDWLLNGTTPQIKIKRQQGGGGVMIWAGIINNQIVGPFCVPDGVKMCAKSYVDFLQQNFLPWYKKQPLALKRKMIFMHDNAPSHAAHYTREALTKFGFKEARLMVWPACSPDLNPIENFWSLLKLNVYEDGKQYSSKNCLWEAIQSCAAAVDKDTIKTLTDSTNNRLGKVIGAKGGYVHY